MRSKRYFLGIIFLAGALFFSVESAQAAAPGCCILDKNKSTADNCQKNSVYTACTGTNSSFFNDDADCVRATRTNYCGSQISTGASHTTSTSDSKQIPTGTSHTSSSSTAGTATAGTTVTTTFVNPIRFSTVSEVVGALLSNLKGIIATVAILFIVIGGAMYILSGGNEKTITTAKNTITSAMIGLAIALAAPTFLKEIQNILGGGSGANPDELVNNALTLNQIAMRTLNLLLSITGILAIIGLVIGGSYYLTAYGDEKRAESGKNIITSAIIGIVIVMAALVIVRQIASLLGVS
ncbi:MAG: pilin [Parcubacteria group bacterium]